MFELGGIGEDVATYCALERSIEEEGRLYQDIVIEEGTNTDNHERAA